MFFLWGLQVDQEPGERNKRSFFKAQKGVCFLSTLFALPFAAGTHFCNLHVHYSDVLCCRPMQNLGHGLKLLIYSEAHSDGDRFILGYFLRLFFFFFCSLARSLH